MLDKTTKDGLWVKAYAAGKRVAGLVGRADAGRLFDDVADAADPRQATERMARNFRHAASDLRAAAEELEAEANKLQPPPAKVKCAWCGALTRGIPIQDDETGRTIRVCDACTK